MGKILTDGFERTFPKSPKENPESFCLTFGVHKMIFQNGS